MNSVHKNYKSKTVLFETKTVRFAYHIIVRLVLKICDGKNLFNTGHVPNNNFVKL